MEDLSDVKIVKTPYGTLRLEPITKEAKDWAIKAIQEKGNEEVQTT